MAAREVREIVVRVDTPGEQGLKKISDGFGKMNRNISEGTSILKKFEQSYFRIMGLSFAGIGFGAVITALDSFQKLNDRLKVTEGSAEGASAALRKLVDVAQYTKSGVQDVSVLYTRLSQSMSELNLGTDAVLGLSIALQNSFRISGATAAEAQGAVIQLSQALSAGGLRGQELRSVMEANGLVAGFLAKKLGIARGELIKFAEKNNGISTQTVLEALSENFATLAAQSEKMTPTIGESLTMALDKAKLALHELNQTSGATKSLSEGILFLGDNMDKLLKVVGYATAAFVAYKAATYGWLALNGAAQLATGIYSGFIGVQLIGFKALIPIVWSYVAAQTAALAVLGPVAIAVGALAAAYLMYNNGSRQLVDTKEKELSQGEKLLIQQDALLRYKSDKIKKEQVENSYMVQVNQGVRDQVQLLAEQSGMTSKATEGIGVYQDALASAAEKVKGMNEGTFNYTSALAKLNKEFGTGGNVKEYKERLKELEIKKLTQEFDKGEISLVKYKKELNEIMNGKPLSSLKQFRGELAEVNKSFESEVAQGNVTNYARALDQVKLDKLSRDLKEGRTSFLEFNKQSRDVEIHDFNRAIMDGSMNLNEYRNSIQGVQLAQLREEWKAGTTDIYAYNKAIVETQDKFAPGSAFFTGTNNYIQQAGTLSQNVASAVTNTFSRLEDAMVEFTTNGKFAFKDFAKAILEDLNRIILRSMVIRPLAQGLLGALTPGESGSSNQIIAGDGGTGAAENYAAKGAYFNGKAAYFAKGGVVNGATPFSYGASKLAVMGEKGPEAIIPLKRNGQGELGVQSAPAAPVIVNITNNSGGEVQQKESRGPNGERMLDIIITQKVKEAFANGTLDKQMSMNYGLRRKGG